MGLLILHSLFCIIDLNQLDEKTQKDLELQLTIGHHMSRTLEDLLDITRLKEHRIQLQRERLNIQAVSQALLIC